MSGDPGIGIKWYTSKLAELGIRPLRVVACRFRAGEISTGGATWGFHDSVPWFLRSPL